MERLIKSLSMVLMLVVGSVFADDHDRVKSLLDAGEIVAADVLIKDAQQKMPGGRLLELELERENDRYVYEIELVDEQGIVWEFFYDAKTEEFIRRGKEE